MNFLLLSYILQGISSITSVALVITACKPTKEIVHKFIRIELETFYENYIKTNSLLCHRYSKNVESICEAISTINNDRYIYRDIPREELSAANSLRKFFINYDKVTKTLAKTTFLLIFIIVAIRIGLDM